MAYDANQLFDEEDEQDQESGLITGQGPGPSSASPAQSTSGVGDGTGEYTPLVKYLDANRDKHQGEKLANRVGEDVGAAESSRDELGQTFRTQADQGSVNTDSGLLDELKSAPTAVLQDPTKKDSFLKQRDAQYQGPSALEDLDAWGDARTATTRGKEAAESSKTEGGQTALLDKYWGRPSYTQGEKALDQYLVSNDDRAPEALGQVQERGAALEPGWDHLQGDVAAYGAAAKDKTAAARTAARGAIGIDEAGNYTGQGALGERNAAIDKRLQDRKAELARLQQQIDANRGAKSISQMSPELLEALGLYAGDTGGATINGPAFYNGGQGLELAGQGSLYGLDPFSQDYFSATPADMLNRLNVSSAEDASAMDALAELAGIEPLLQGDRSQVGTYDDEKLARLDSGKLRTAAAGRAQAMQNEANQIAQKYQQLSIDPYAKERANWHHIGSTPDEVYGPAPDLNQLGRAFMSEIAALKKKYGVL